MTIHQNIFRQIFEESVSVKIPPVKILCYTVLLRSLPSGSGGNNHALEHFQQTHYPLCVKLGTITPDGAGDALSHVMSHDLCMIDVFSYDEDTMVEDPNLAQHLAHFGINVALMTKVCCHHGGWLLHMQ